MVPPWTPDLPPDPAADGSPDDDGGDGTAPPPAAPPAPTAPGTRFQRAKLALGRFAQSGSRGDLRRALGTYVSNGYGGSRMATRRAGGTVATAGVFGSTLAAIAAGGGPLDRAVLDADPSVRAIISAIVDAVRSVDGTLDAEAERASIDSALSEVLNQYPDADLLLLDDEQRAFAVERFVANDVYRRFELDLGKVIVDKAPNNITASQRLKEAGDYVRQCVAASFQKLRSAGRTLIGQDIVSIVSAAIEATYHVFEEYLQ